MSSKRSETPGKEARNAYMRQYRKRDPQRIKAIQRRGHLKWKFGISLEQYEAMFAAQNGRCAICGKPEETALSVDHNHVTGAVRALLCRKCNAALGAFDESVVTLQKAIEYLRRY